MHVRLRRIRRNDLDWLVAMAVDPASVGAHNWVPVDPTELVSSWNARLERDGFVARSDGRFVVELDDGTPIGDVAWRTERWGPSAESACPAIGIALLPTHRGQGHGTAAQRLLVEYLFRVVGVHRVQSDTASDNIAEQRALARAGLQREGVVRDAEYRDGRYHDHVLFGALRREWTPDDQLAARIPVD